MRRLGDKSQGLAFVVAAAVVVVVSVLPLIIIPDSARPCLLTASCK
jgi:hypothetical protein